MCFGEVSTILDWNEGYYLHGSCGHQVFVVEERCQATSHSLDTSLTRIRPYDIGQEGSGQFSCRSYEPVATWIQGRMRQLATSRRVSDEQLFEISTEGDTIPWYAP